MRMDITAVQKVYRRYAQGYDLYFGAMFQQGRQAIITKMNCHPGDRILEAALVGLHAATPGIAGWPVTAAVMRA